MQLAFFALSYVVSAVEVLVLQDVSNGAVMKHNIPAHMKSVLSSLASDFEGSLKVGVASFVDKPNVHVGTGTYGGWPGPYNEDWCYRLISPLSSNIADATAALDNVGLGSGMDILEAQFEALLRGVTDPDMGWTDDEEKVVVIVTDSFGHCEALNTLREHVNKYNTPVRCIGGSEKTAGGVGAYQTKDLMQNWIRIELQDTYYDFAELVYRRTCLGDLTEEEMALFEQKKIEYGPVRVPKVKPFDIEVLKADPETHCRYHEYPDYPDMLAVLGDFKLMIVLFEEDTTNNYATWEWTLTDATQALGTLPSQLTHVMLEDDFEATVLADLKSFIKA